jgi:hypothetical protein
MELKKIPGCPSCKGEVIVTEYICPKCGITVRGKFRSGPFSELNDEQVSIVAAFLASGGNIRQMESRLGMSYPTVKTRLREINIALGLETEEQIVESDKSSILDKLEKGEIDVQKALEELEKEKK